MTKSRGRRSDKIWLQRVGRDVLWEQALLRPNRRYDGSRDFTAGEPRDRGYNYEEPKKIKGIVTSSKRGVAFELASAMEDGRCRITYDPDLPIGDQDRITFLTLPVRSNIELLREAGDVDEIPLAFQIVEILTIRDETRTYKANRDFRVVMTGDLVTGLDWSQGESAPAEGERFGLLIYMRPVWIVQGNPKERSFGEKQLLPRVDLVLDDGRIRS